MKTKLTQTIHRTYKVDFDREVTNVIHDLPTWMFPEFSYGATLKNPCPVCGKEMRLNIAHGIHIEKCSMIQLDNHDTMPIHTECYEKIKDNTR